MPVWRASETEPLLERIGRALRGIRPPAVGKKNFLFVGHPVACWRSAVICSVLGSCRRYGVGRHEYLREVLGRLLAMKIIEIEMVTPSAWAKAKKAAARAAKRAA